MTPLSNAENLLARLFAGLTEHTFLAELGIADTQLIDYVSRMLARFVHRDAIFAVRGPDGRRLEELVAMLLEAERKENQGNPRREIYRHAGDFALFWTGVYPEWFTTRAFAWKRDSLLDYREQGKRSYYLASTYADTPTQAEEAPVLRRLSDQFELCAFGLRQVRSHWEEAAVA